ncbi:MAG: thrombospondin type 3 repeat-containing protein [Deltaproteobacteria bacterium]|nr:thrombospondin type 3 repeat-containing protein [Deltaproteobacteria bacterium]
MKLGSRRNPILLLAVILAGALIVLTVGFPGDQEGCGGPVSEESTSAPVISDQAHNGGTAGFFFLPPLVPEPAHQGVFEPGLLDHLTVRIDQMGAVDGGAQATIQAFSSKLGPGAERISETIRVDLAGEHYIVNWKTEDGAELSTELPYRITVSVAGRDLGFIDVDVVGTNKELRNVNTGDFIGLVDGRTLPVKFRIEKATVDTDGDGFFDFLDNCPLVANATQSDADGDGAGDACPCEGGVSSNFGLERASGELAIPGETYSATIRSTRCPAQKTEFVVTGPPGVELSTGAGSTHLTWQVPMSTPTDPDERAVSFAVRATDVWSNVSQSAVFTATVAAVRLDASQTLSTGGGSLTAGAVSLTVPSGVLSADTSFSLGHVVPPVVLPSGLQQLSAAVSIYPAGLVFDEEPGARFRLPGSEKEKDESLLAFIASKYGALDSLTEDQKARALLEWQESMFPPGKATLVLPYTKTPGYEQVALFTYVEGGGVLKAPRWEPVLRISVDDAAGTVTAHLHHLSTYVVVGAKSYYDVGPLTPAANLLSSTSPSPPECLKARSKAKQLAAMHSKILALGPYLETIKDYASNAFQGPCTFQASSEGLVGLLPCSCATHAEYMKSVIEAAGPDYVVMVVDSNGVFSGTTCLFAHFMVVVRPKDNVGRWYLLDRYMGTPKWYPIKAGILTRPPGSLDMGKWWFSVEDPIPVDSSSYAVLAIESTPASTYFNGVRDDIEQRLCCPDGRYVGDVCLPSCSSALTKVGLSGQGGADWGCRASACLYGSTDLGQTSDCNFCCTPPAPCVQGYEHGADGECYPIESCANGVKNGTETDVDCGGDLCSHCDNSKKCKLASDCKEGICEPPPYRVEVRAFNSDDTTNVFANEAPVLQVPYRGDSGLVDITQKLHSGANTLRFKTTNDAGGYTWGYRVRYMGDLQLMSDCGLAGLEGCNGNDVSRTYRVIHDESFTVDLPNMDPVCRAPGTCTDRIKNGTETDVDCGGGACQPCADGKRCNIGRWDCWSRSCSGGSCRAPTCTDGILNGAERNADCGGTCPKCGIGAICASNGDCSSGLCYGQRCIAPCPAGSVPTPPFGVCSNTAPVSTSECPAGSVGEIVNDFRLCNWSGPADGCASCPAYNNGASTNRMGCRWPGQRWDCADGWCKGCKTPLRCANGYCVVCSAQCSSCLCGTCNLDPARCLP